MVSDRKADSEPHAQRRPRTSRPGRAPVSTPSRAGDLAGDDRGSVAPCPLQQSAATSRQIVNEFRRLQLQGVVIDEVQVGAFADLDRAPVAKPEQGGGVRGLLFTTHSSGSCSPRLRSRVQCEIIVVGTDARR